MLRAAALSGLGLSLAGCAFSVPEDAYTVAEVKQDISAPTSALDGRLVTIVGWLGDCGGNDCAIYATAQDAAMVATGDDENPEWLGAMDRRLSIGFDEDFDRLASGMQQSRVLVRGVVNAKWHRPADDSGTAFGCLDRCDDIRPLSVERLVN